MEKENAPMTMEEWLVAVEEASGMTREQFRALGMWPKEGACRLLQCKGWHFTTDERERQLQEERA